MIKDVKTVIARSNGTFVQDFLGLCALVILLFGALHIPGLF